MYPTERIELPLWGNIIAVAVVAILFGFIIRDLIEVFCK
jgi:hypothetical protein